MKTKIIKTYKPKPGAWFGKEKAQIYGERLSELEEKNGKITAHVIVEDAKNINSPLHDAFEWDDKKEAERWRIHKARRLIDCIITVVVINEKEYTMPSYVNIEIENDKGYYPIEEVMKTEKGRDNLLDQAWDDLETWRERYDYFKEFVKIYKAIDETKEELK